MLSFLPSFSDCILCAVLSAARFTLQASFAFNVLEEALRLILEKMEDLSSLAAETARLAGLLAALRAADIDAGGDGNVIGFGNPPRSSQPGQGLQAAAGLLAAKDSTVVDLSVNTHRSDHDVELADRAETTLLLQSPDGQGPPGTSNGVVSEGFGGGGIVRLSRVLRLMDGSVPGLSVEGLTASVPGRHHQETVVCQGLSFQLHPGEWARSGDFFKRQNECWCRGSV